MVGGIKPLMVLCSFDMAKKMKRGQKSKAKKRKLEFELYSDSDDEENDDEDENLLFDYLIQEGQHWNTEIDDHDEEEEVGRVDEEEDLVEDRSNGEDEQDVSASDEG